MEKFKLYIYEGKPFPEALVGNALDGYFASQNMQVGDFEILRTEKGKPYIEGNPAYFNISHSGELWVMMVGPSPVGIDIQEMDERVNYTGVAKRLFGENEAKFIKKYGADGFYRLWTHFEAVRKYCGLGIFSGRMTLTDEDGCLLDEIETENGPVYVKDIHVATDIFLAYATGNELEEYDVEPIF